MVAWQSEIPGALETQPGQVNRYATGAGTFTLSHLKPHDQDARGLTLALRGRWHGRYGAAPCPACQPEARRDQVALTLTDGSNGRLLLHCKKSGCAFTDILAAAGLRPSAFRTPDPAVIAQREAETRIEARRKEKQARRLWQEAPADQRHLGRNLPAQARHHL